MLHLMIIRLLLPSFITRNVMFSASVQIISHLVDGAFAWRGCRLLELTLRHVDCHGFGFDD